MNQPYKKELHFGITDIIVFAVIATLVYSFFNRMGAVLDYQWDWRMIPDYLIRKDVVSGNLKTNLLIQGFATTIKLSFRATLLAIIMGTFFRPDAGKRITRSEIYRLDLC